MEQEVKYINISKLVLWAENSRDPINENATDQNIVNRALDDDARTKWSLPVVSRVINIPERSRPLFLARDRISILLSEHKLAGLSS